MKYLAASVIALSISAVLGLSLSDPRELRSMFGALGCSAPEVVFDSNLSGNFGIYRACADGNSEAKVVIDTPEWHEVYPDPSPDGTKIVYARAKQPDRDAAAEVWLLDLETGAQTLVTNNGTFPSFSADGSKIFFGRNRLAAFEYTIANGQERHIFPWPGLTFANRVVAKPRVSPDEKWIYFSSTYPHQWTAWRVNLEDSTSERLGHGCQPSSYADTSAAVWIQKRRGSTGSDVYRLNPQSLERELFQQSGENTYAYYPESSSDGKYLLYSGCNCPPHNMSHESGNYEVRLVDIPRGETTQVTRNGATNRWPKLLPNS